MNREEYKWLRNDIVSILCSSIKETSFMFNYFLDSYVSSIISFGWKHNIPIDSKNAFLEYCKIKKEEAKLLRYILQQYSTINDLESQLYLDKLDELNEQTFMYYVDVFQEIKDASVLKQEWRAKRKTKNFDTLIETNQYQKEMVFLTVSLKDIQEFLKLPQAYLEYIQKNAIFVDDFFYLYPDDYSIYLYTEKENLIDIQIVLPYPVNLRTALKSLSLLYQGHCFFKKVGGPLAEAIANPISTENLQKRFEEEYFVKKLEIYKR